MYFEEQANTDIAVPVDAQEHCVGTTADSACGTVEDTAPRILDYDSEGDYDTDADYDTGYDTDGDGRNDTVLITAPSGSSVLLTDVDGDGAADIATKITDEGRITVSEHTGNGQWIVVERDQLGSDGSTQRTDSVEPAGSYQQDDSAGRADDASVGFASSGSDSAGSSSAADVVSIDPITGEWISAGKAGR